MINPKNDDIKNDIANDITVAGTDLFADSESFLVELNDSELAQVNGGNGHGGGGVNSGGSLLLCGGSNSGGSLLLCAV